MRLTVIGELQVNTVAVARVALVAQDALVEPVASESPAEQVELVGLVGLGAPVVQGELAV
jgi:hypothetical protein